MTSWLKCSTPGSSDLASHPGGGGGGRNTPSRFMLQKPEISAGLLGLSRLVTETIPFLWDF